MNKPKIQPVIPKTQAIEIIKSKRRRYNPIYKLWNGLSEPRIVTFLTTLLYLMSTIYGIWQLGHHKIYLDELLTVPVGNVVASLFILGGVIGLMTSPKGYWQFERAGIIFIVTGFTVHVFWVLMDPMPGVRWGLVYDHMFCILSLISRYSTISWARMDPEK